MSSFQSKISSKPLMQKMKQRPVVSHPHKSKSGAIQLGWAILKNLCPTPEQIQGGRAWLELTLL